MMSASILRGASRVNRVCTTPKISVKFGHRSLHLPLNMLTTGGCRSIGAPSFCHNRFFSTAPKITAAMVKELREKSGAPMMDCKKALSADGVDGDITLAMDWLRTKGIARAASNADRVTMEGVVAVNRNAEGFVTLLEVNSETDFVSMNQDFQKFVSMVSDVISSNHAVANNGCSGTSSVDVEALMASLVPDATNGDSNGAPASSATGSATGSAVTIQDALGDIISSIRENIVIKRAAVIHPTTATGTGTGTGTGGGSMVSAYVHGKVGQGIVPSHIELGKVAAVVQLSTTTSSSGSSLDSFVQDVGRKLCMHIVAAQPTPLYVAATDVPAEVVERETSILREQTIEGEAAAAAAVNSSSGSSSSNKSKSKSAAKPKTPEMIERIVAGKVSKRLSEICLLSQTHVAAGTEKPVVIGKYLKDLLRSNEAIQAGGCSSTDNSGVESAELRVDGFQRWTLGG